ncbi:TPA: class B sortase [Clostridioides difficile]|uniref:class B sortase n=3 Tax=Clostridioides difficile TaxID=1496 RepID=UPI00093B8328|nr:class B sortase [Clostridioides difficile]MBY1103882.1 class B sortase [Clostridioides difficile]MDC9475573.1 class B sortase [Clostridioides difficile]HBE9760566.1 class B sortase [Clostridioides difficile]HBE9786743.1 class B sortase [Clostridioides difficile]HBG3682634.1 class B sortase [Clostridioides difficile]
MKILVKILINIICIITLIFSSLSVYIKLSEYRKADEVYTELRENTSNNNSKHQELYDKNNDYRFWLKINNVNIDYPVVQGYNNDFYLTHDFYKNYLPLGSIFMDYRNNFENDKSLIVYGHYMKNKTMFGQLENYTDEVFFKENNLVEINYKVQTYTYEIFSVYTADLINRDYLSIHFNSNYEFKDYLNYITERSVHKSDIKVDISDKIITLYTCNYEFKDARTIVHAKLISKKETDK